MKVDRITADYLRRYRDEILATSRLGGIPIAAYRRASRVFTPVLARNEALRNVSAAAVMAIGRYARWRVDRKTYGYLRRRPVQRLAVELATRWRKAPRS